MGAGDASRSLAPSCGSALHPRPRGPGGRLVWFSHASSQASLMVVCGSVCVHRAVSLAMGTRGGFPEVSPACRSPGGGREPTETALGVGFLRGARCWASRGLSCNAPAPCRSLHTLPPVPLCPTSVFGFNEFIGLTHAAEPIAPRLRVWGWISQWEGGDGGLGLHSRRGFLPRSEAVAAARDLVHLGFQSQLNAPACSLDREKVLPRAEVASGASRRGWGGGGGLPARVVKERSPTKALRTLHTRQRYNCSPH